MSGGFEEFWRMGVEECVVLAAGGTRRRGEVAMVLGCPGAVYEVLLRGVDGAEVRLIAEDKVRDWFDLAGARLTRAAGLLAAASLALDEHAPGLAARLGDLIQQINEAKKQLYTLRRR